MSRRELLDLFEKKKDYMNDRINNGIEMYRKGYADLTVTDENGNPLKNATIKINQKSHEFKFGANLFMLDEFESQEKCEKYRKYFSELFNMATLPFYWDSTEPEEGKTRYAKDSCKLYRRPAIDLCIEFCEENGIEPREHALAYDYFFPKWVRNRSVHEIKKALEKRYSEIAERYKNKIPTIEVTNEMEWPVGKTAFYDEEDYIEWCFKLAEKYFPCNQLVINERTLLSWTDACRATDKYYAYIQANMLKGARIDAIGLQYHMHFKQDVEYEKTRPYYDPENLYRHMDLYSDFGKPLQITEITIPAQSTECDDEEVQADLFEYLYSIWFSHPNVEQIVYWNVVDGYAFVESTDPEVVKASQGDMTLGENVFYAGLVRFDMTPKPAYYRLKELIQKRWHTEAELVTDENGNVSFKGFYGKYDIEYECNGKTIVKEIDFSKKGKKKFEI